MARRGAFVSALALVAALTGCRQPSAPSADPVSLADGSWPYTLTVTPNNACLLGYDGTIGSPIVTPIYPAEMALEAPLVVNGEHLSFVLPQHVSDYYRRTGVTVDISRSGDQIAGTIGGGFSLMARTSLSIGVWRDGDSTIANVPAPVIGAIRADRSLAGVFSGFVQVSYVPSNVTKSCTAPQYGWTLTPRLP